MHEGSLTLHATRIKAGTLAQLADMMEAVPPVGDIEFGDAVKALVTIGVKPQEIARRFSVDTTTVHDWVQSRTVPHQIARAHYATHLVRIARCHADMYLVACGAPLAKAA